MCDGLIIAWAIFPGVKKLQPVPVWIQTLVAESTGRLLNASLEKLAYIWYGLVKVLKFRALHHFFTQILGYEGWDSFVYLFDLILYSQSTIFQSSWVEPELSKDKCVLLKDTTQ